MSENYHYFQLTSQKDENISMRLCPASETAVHRATCCLIRLSEAPSVPFNALYILKQIFMDFTKSFKSNQGCSCFSGKNNCPNTGHGVALKHGQLGKEIITLTFTHIGISLVNIRVV